MRESKAELNAGLIIVAGHTPTQIEDVDMSSDAPDVSMQTAGTAHSDTSDSRAHKARRLAHPANSKIRMNGSLRNSRARFLATTAVPKIPWKRFQVV